MIRKILKRMVLLAILAPALAAPTLAHEVTVGPLLIIHPHIPQPATSAKSAGGYMAIVNNGTEAERLIGVETPIAAKASLHESMTDADGVSSMTMLDGIALPPGETVNLEPGAIHIMFMGLTGPLTQDKMVKVTLVFEHMGPVEIEFMIDPPGEGGMSGMDHEMSGDM